MKIISHDVEIRATPQTIWRLLTEAASFGRWLGAKAELDLRPGGRIRWEHANGDVCSGCYIEISPFVRLTFTYGWERADVGVPPGSTLVEFVLEPTDEATWLRVRHYGLEGPMADAHRGGWSHYIGRLQTLGHGTDPGPDSFASLRVPTWSELGMEPPGPSPSDEAFFRAIGDELTQTGPVSWSTMMGFPCLRHEGAFFASFSQSDRALVIKLPASRVAALVGSGTGNAFAPAGKVFREWVAIPASSRPAWQGYLADALSFVQQATLSR